MGAGKFTRNGKTKSVPTHLGVMLGPEKPVEDVRRMFR